MPPALGEHSRFQWRPEAPKSAVGKAAARFRDHVAVTIGPNIYVLGGQRRGEQSYFSLICYSVPSENWRDLSGLPNCPPRGLATEIFLVRDTIYVCVSSGPGRALWSFDTVLEEWTCFDAKGAVPSELIGCGIEYVEHRGIAVKFGGENEVGRASSEFLQLRLSDLKWEYPEYSGDLPRAATYSIVSTVVKDTVYMFIGATADMFLLHCEGRGPLRWSRLSNSIPPHPEYRLAGATLTYIGGNMIALVGGTNHRSERGLWFFAIDKRRWRPVLESVEGAPLSVKGSCLRNGACAAYANEELIVIGGASDSDYSLTRLVAHDA